MTNELPEACIGFDEDLSALIDEELSSEREAEVRAHLEGCDRCVLRLQELCNVDLELAGLAQPAVSPELSRGLMARVAVEGDAGPDEEAAAGDAPRPARPPARGAAPPARRRWLPGGAFARVAVAAGLVLAAWLLLRGDPGVAPEEPIAGTGAELPVVPAPERPPEPLLAEQPKAPPLRDVTPPAPESSADRGSAPTVAGRPDLADLPVEDLAMLLELEEVEDLDLIANLELLETLVDLEREAG